MKRPDFRRLRSERGSVILLAMGFAAILMIATTGFITACYRSTQLSNRAFNSARSLQFAEMGMEEALWSLKRNDWTDWKISGSTATRTIGGFTYSDGCSGEIHLRLQNYNSNPTSLVIEGQTTLPDGSTVRKQVVATASQAPIFTNAIFSTGSTTFQAGGTVDSYNSADGPYVAENAGFSAIVAGSSVGAGASATGSVIVNDANIKGYVAYSGLAPSFGVYGSLSGPSTPGNVRIDPSRFNLSPWQNFPDIKPATGGDQLPTSGSFTIGTPGATTPSTYFTDTLALYGGRVITVDGPVILDISHFLYIDSSGARIEVTSHGSLEIHTHGGYFLAGAGIINETQDPKKVALFSEFDSDDFNAQVFAVTADFYGVIYSPQAVLTIHDWIRIYGSVVARSTIVAESSNPQIHYDTALRAPNASFSGLSPVYQLTNWREITDPAEMIQF